MEEYPELSIWAPNAITIVLRKHRGHPHRHAQKACEDAVKGMLLPTGAGRRQGVDLEVVQLHCHRGASDPELECLASRIMKE